MANPDDFPQMVEGKHEEGDSVVADEFHVGVLTKDESGQYKLIRLYSDGSAAGQGVGALVGKDASGDLHYLKTTSDGEAIINIGAADSTWVAGSATLVTAVAGVVVTESPGATTKYIGMIVSGSGLCDWELQFGTTGAEATIAVVQTTPSRRAEPIMFPAPLGVASTETVRIRGINREKGASPGSDFTGYATLIKEA